MVQLNVRKKSITLCARKKPITLQVHPAVFLSAGIPYEGEYEVTPKVDGQFLPTKDRILIDDIEVKAVPYYEMSTQNGGTTIYIASEV